MKCGWSELDMATRVFSRCVLEAKFTCCDYGGAVCYQHRCRCSKPLELEGENPAIELGTE